MTPLGLAWRNGHWLLAAHCHLRRAFRHFRVDRVREVRLARGRLDRKLAPPGFDPRFFSAEGYLVSGRRPPALATVQLRPPLAGVLLPAALLERTGATTVLCHLRVTDDRALARLVESLGEAASRVGAPPGREGGP